MCAEARPVPRCGLEEAPPAREHEEEEIGCRAVLGGEPVAAGEAALEQVEVTLRLGDCDGPTSPPPYRSG